MDKALAQHRWRRASQAARMFNEVLRKYNPYTDHPVGNKAKKIVKAHRIYMGYLNMCPTTVY